MAGNNYEVFDDGAFYWFGMTMLFFGLALPTYRRVRGLFSPDDEVTPAVERKEHVLPYDETRLSLPSDGAQYKETKRVLRAERDASRKAKRYTFGTFVFVIGWILLLYGLSRIGEYQNKEVLSFDPYEILGVEKGVEVPAIKKAYRKLSLKYHPDRNPGDQDAANKFVLIAKAHTTLTDDTARENWEKYGNPDGYQGTSTVIGLPSFLVKEENHIIVLISYLLIVIVAPIVLGFFYWRHISNHMDGGIKLSTGQRFFEAMVDTSNPKLIVEKICLAGEFEVLGKTCSGQAAYQKLAELNAAISEQMTRPQHPQVPFVMAGNILLHSHLLRVGVHPSLRPQLSHALRSAFRVSHIMMELANHPQKRCRQIPMTTVRLLQSLSQAVWPGESALLQLPHITEDELYYFLVKNRKKVRTIAEFLAMSEDDRSNVLRNHTPQQISEMVSAARIIPNMKVSCRIENRFAEDEDMPAFDDDDGAEAREMRERAKERQAQRGANDTNIIYEGDVLALYVTLERRTEGDVHDGAGGDEAQSGRVVTEGEGGVTIVEDGGTLAAHVVSEEHKRKEKGTQGSFFTNKGDDTRAPIVAHTPHLPFVKQEMWHVFLTSATGYVVGVAKVASPKSPKEEVAVNFLAPPKGTHELHVHVMCDSYIGVDHLVKVKVKVDKSKESYQREAEVRIERELKERIANRKAVLKARKRRGSDSDSEEESDVSSVDTEDALDYSTEEDELDIDIDDPIHRGESTDGKSGAVVETLSYIGAAAVVGITIISYLQNRGYLDPLLVKFGFDPMTPPEQPNMDAGAGEGPDPGASGGEGSAE